MLHAHAAAPYEISDGTHFLRIRQAPRDLSPEGNSTCEITRKLDHFAGSFSSGPSKSIPVDSIIATRSTEGIPSISLEIRECARVKDKINKRRGARSPARERKRLPIFWRLGRPLPLDVSENTVGE